MSSDDNRRIYEEVYSATQCQLPSDTAYGRGMLARRLGFIDRYAGPIVVDLCCGSGSYTKLAAEPGRLVLGLDFSGSLLRAAKEELVGEAQAHLVQTDATRPGVADGFADLVYSFSSLYYVERLDAAIASVARMLRPGGHAVLEVGNRWSLNTLVSREAERNGWARSFHVPVSRLRSMLAQEGLEVVEWRAFQLLPMQGTPRRLAPLLPLLTIRWRGLLETTVRGRLLDEWLSSMPLLRRFAFRQVVVVRKR